MKHSNAFTSIETSLNGKVANLVQDKEGAEYQACSFEINGLKFISRTAKTTPKKVGQFVTFWKRNSAQITTPFSINDNFDFYIIFSEHQQKKGVFVIAKNILAKNGIISTHEKDGKRGFRVYNIWDQPQSKQAIKTQKWQTEYFTELTEGGVLWKLKHRLTAF